MKWKWPWARTSEPSPETLEAKAKLEQVKRDGVKLEAITRRTREIMDTNHLGADIKRALRGESR